MIVRAFVALTMLARPAAAEPAAADFAVDATSIERRVNEDYGYLDRFPGQRMPMTDRLRAEAAAVNDQRSLVKYAERAMALLADHHAIVGSSFKDSWALVPSYSDLWIEHENGAYVITSVRSGSPGEQAEVRVGDRLIAVGGQPVEAAVKAYWDDLGSVGGGERDAVAARVLAAGRRDRPRQLTIAGRAGSRQVNLPSLYAAPQIDRPPVSTIVEGRTTRLRFADSLGNDATIAAFDAAMASVRPGQRLIIDLTDTPSGGNTSVARAILGWFVSRPTGYQVHNLPAEQRSTGIARQWVEQVLPRPGKRWHGAVTVRVGRWTGSMGEGLAIGFDAIGARVRGHSHGRTARGDLRRAARTVGAGRQIPGRAAVGDRRHSSREIQATAAAKMMVCLLHRTTIRLIYAGTSEASRTSAASIACIWRRIK